MSNTFSVDGMRSESLFVCHLEYNQHLTHLLQWPATTYSMSKYILHLQLLLYGRANLHGYVYYYSAIFNPMIKKRKYFKFYVIVVIQLFVIEIKKNSV